MSDGASASQGEGRANRPGILGRCTLAAMVLIWALNAPAVVAQAPDWAMESGGLRPLAEEDQPVLRPPGPPAWSATQGEDRQPQGETYAASPEEPVVSAWQPTEAAPPATAPPLLAAVTGPMPAGQLRQPPIAMAEGEAVRPRTALATVVQPVTTIFPPAGLRDPLQAATGRDLVRGPMPSSGVPASLSGAARPIATEGSRPGWESRPGTYGASPRWQPAWLAEGMSRAAAGLIPASGPASVEAVPTPGQRIGGRQALASPEIRAAAAPPRPMHLPAPPLDR